MRLNLFAAAAALLFFAQAHPAIAGDCGAAGVDQELETVDATADTWPNLRNQPGSLKYESKRMLTMAAETAKTAVPASIKCPEGCKAGSAAVIRYQTVPKKFRSDNSDAERCKQLLEQTTAKPFLYSDRKFKSIDDLTAWFGDFSTGAGKDGKDLYLKCDGDCSPQYFTEIHPSGSGYTVDSSVVCGAARDKTDNKYGLKLFLHWICEAG